MNSAALSLRLDKVTAKALEDEAARTKRSKGYIVRAALAEHLERARPGAATALAKYAGCVGGPSDLSTNKAYLATLGRRRKR
jgi:hypothetical protein